jgi:hypothetical protein
VPAARIQLGEPLDRPVIGKSARPPLDQLAEHVDDPAELATVGSPVVRVYAQPA